MKSFFVFVAILLSLATSHSVWGQGKCVVLKSFGYPVQSGSEPRGTILVADGMLYGTTLVGGAYNRGTVFSMRLNGSDFHVLHSFNVNDGYNPESGLVLGIDGALYGTAAGGGARNSGVVFKLNTDGTGFKVLHNLDFATSGREPRAGLIEARDGKLYGVAMAGGSSGGGTIFALNTNGTVFKVVHSFNAVSSDGATPAGELIEDDAGALYGVAAGGGHAQSGLIFRVNLQDSRFTVLHRFGATGNDGRNPTGRLLCHGKVLYGITATGGPLGCGTVFMLNVDGSGYQTLHRFNNENRSPIGPLVRRKDGTLYGVTSVGGTYNGGSIFQLTSDRKYSVIHYFGRLDTRPEEHGGRGPLAGLTIDENETIYGTTQAGGAHALGMVFSFK
jgi:uncharacterized repeat protein (TIGR03803 family)